MVDRPAPCEACPVEFRKQWGCGCTKGTPWTASAEGEGYAGQGEPLPEGARLEPHSRTCRQWFYRSPFVRSIHDKIEDYRGGRLGKVTELPAPLATYLRVTSRELDRAKTYWDTALLPDG